jgi:predicted nucleic acid-binding Zn ribbon protein
VARTRYDEPDEDEDEDSDWEPDEDHYDPDEPETYPHGLYDDDGPPTVPCPHCGADILEDSEQCPKCGSYVSKEDAPAGSGKSAAWWVLVLLALAVVLMWIVGVG